MQITVKRNKFLKDRTLGQLFINGAFFCYTCEDTWRNGKKIAGKTCINPGTYKVVLSFSNRFQTYLPEVLNVPNFQGIRIHSGNTEADTEGCLLVGKTQDDNGVYTSRATMAALMARLKAVEKTEPITITYVHS